MHVPTNDHEIFEQEKRDAIRAKRLTRYEMQVAGVVVYMVAMTVLFVVALVFMLFWNETGTRAHAQSPESIGPTAITAHSAAQNHR